MHKRREGLTRVGSSLRDFSLSLTLGSGVEWNENIKCDVEKPSCARETERESRGNLIRCVFVAIRKKNSLFHASDMHCVDSTLQQQPSASVRVCMQDNWIWFAQATTTTNFLSGPSSRRAA